MDTKNSKLSIYAPLVLAVVFALGIYLGNLLNFQSKDNKISLKSEPNKLDLIIDLIESDYVDTVSTSDLIEEAVPYILKNLDPHSIYIPAKDLKQVNEPLEGNFEGIGVQFNLLNDTILVINTISGGPAEKVGLMAGDKIITINDSLFAGKKITNEDVIKNLKGEQGTTVKVGVARIGFDKLLSFEITRNKVPLYSVDVAYMMSEDIGYVKISAFARTTYDEFMQAVNNLHKQGMKKIVLDLRSNTGGYLDAAISIIDEFLEKDKLIVYTEGKARPRYEYKATKNGACLKDELVVLIDSWSASASEIVAGAIQDNDRGTIVGRRSFGKGLVQESSYFRDGSALRLTIARYYTPTGRSIQKSYSKGNDEYELDLLHRYENGEFESADSTVFADSLKFVTKGGKIVYGGGGIMPDVFVAVDTLGVTP
ncbi:MAG TPA: S41 family peptidase, partial [Caldithrix sp.]|nr:S41 family peptidase [Caldithrix sp.]